MAKRLRLKEVDPPMMPEERDRRAADLAERVKKISLDPPPPAPSPQALEELKSPTVPIDPIRGTPDDPLVKIADALEEIVRQNRARMRVFRLLIKTSQVAFQQALEAKKDEIPPGMAALIQSVLAQFEDALK